MAAGRWKLTLLLALLFVALAFLFYNVSSPLAMSPDEAKARLQRGQFDHVIDVRTQTEWDMGHYPLAIHISVADILNELPKRVPDKQAKLLIYCNTSTRARVAAEKAKSMGYTNVRYLLGTHRNLL
jgi:phage shock protein E